MNRRMWFFLLSSALSMAEMACDDEQAESSLPPVEVGGEGQGCREDGSCDVGLECNAEKICVKKESPPVEKGGLNQPCEDDGTCDADLKCNAENTCIKEPKVPTCAPACDENTEECVEGKCVAKGGSLIKVCAQPCQNDTACTLKTGAMKYRCHPTAKRCVECLADDDCVALLSLWTYSCTKGGDECVDAYEACIDIGGGNGRCAEKPTPSEDCDPWEVKETRPALDGSGDVTVCVDKSAQCNKDNLCIVSNTAIVDCTKEGCEIFGAVGRTDCDPVTKKCVCNKTSCQQTGYSQCLPDGTCGCLKDEECKWNKAYATCYPDGRCGCTSTESCAAETIYEASGSSCVESSFYYPW